MRRDYIELTELQEGLFGWEGKSRADWKEKRKRESLAQGTSH